MNLKKMFNNNKGDLINYAVAYFARGNGIKDLYVGNNYYGIENVPEEDKIQAISFNRSLITTLKLLNTKIHPSLENIKKNLNKKNTQIRVFLISDDVIFEGTVFYENLRNKKGLWMDMRQLQEVDTKVTSATPELKKVI